MTDADAPRAVADHLAEHGGVDIVVHNAGITRDKTARAHGRGPLDAVIDINLSRRSGSQRALLGRRLLNDGAGGSCPCPR